MGLSVCSVLLLGAAPGCDHNRGGPDDPAALLGALPATDVRDVDFAAAVHRLMREGEPSAERSALLAGTVRRQMRHAARHFRAGDEARGADAVVGALYLVRAGEARDDMFDAEGLYALERCFRRFSALGDEGSTQAMLALQRRALPKGSPGLAELGEHESALLQWMRDTRPTTEMERLGARQRVAVARALLEPSETSLDAARRATNDWVKRAVDINLAYQRTRKAPRRAVIVDAYKALQLGSETMAAVFLRHGRAKEAVAALEAGAAGRVADAEFIVRLEAAARDDTAEEWRLLGRAIRGSVLDDEEVKMSARLLDAAHWGIALEAYRRDPTSYAIGHVLSRALRAHGMPEAAPLVLGDALGLDPTTVSLSGVLSVVAESLAERLDIEDAATARRIYNASKGVLAIADRERFRNRVQPSPSAIRRLMASIEIQDGSAAGARPLMVKALQAAPTLDGYLELATLDRQSGKLDVALNQVRRAAKLPSADGLPLRAAEAHLLAFEVLRDKGDREQALQELEVALELAASTGNSGSFEHQVRAALVLARVLDGYGARERATLALEKALGMTSGGHELLGEALLAAVAHAFVHEDLQSARAAVQLGFKGHVDGKTMIRAALWLMMLELELGEKPDGKVDRVLVDATDETNWWSLVARWARRMESDATLRKASARHAEKVRAEFYISLRARATARAGGVDFTDETLRRIASDPMHQEPEVGLARALTAPRMTASVPEGVQPP